MREVGLHLRLSGSLLALFNRALQLKLSTFQCFFILQETGRFIKAFPQEIDACRSLRSSFNNLYLHGSYAVNLTASEMEQYAFKREITLAKKIGFTHFVLHPGSSKGAANRTEAIEKLAKSLDRILKNEHEIQIVLENVAHGGMAIGGDFEDFRLLKEKLLNADRLQFCIDTAHAHSFGYALDSVESQNAFITTINTTIGLDSVALVHLNDTPEKLGSKIDRHCEIGKGNLSEELLRNFVVHPSLSTVPIILELPLMPELEEEALLSKVRSWHT